MRKRVRLHFTQDRGWHVDLPTFRIIDGSFLPVTKDIITSDGIPPKANPNDVAGLLPTVEVDIPDEYIADDGSGIDFAKIRAIHKGHPRWDDDAKPPRI